MADTLASTTTALLGRMLRRLPSSLWDVDPASPTVQRDLYAALASQMAVWLESREIARTMTLLLEAQGVDLDTLMADYGLKRYMGRTDDYARQIAEHILFRPKGTAFAVDQLATLLLTVPHLTMRTGRSELHVFIPQTHNVTTPYQYWGLMSQDGIWYALSVQAEVPVIMQSPPPGIDVAPGPLLLSWFRVLDELSATWYVSIVGDTLQVTTTQPFGNGTTTPFQVREENGQIWTLSVDSRSEALITTAGGTATPTQTVMTFPPTPYQTLQLRDSSNGVWWLSVTTGGVPQFTSSQPGGSTNITPTGGPFRWLRVFAMDGTRWHLFPSTGGTVQVSTTAPGGTGTNIPAAFGDSAGVRWRLGIRAGGLVTSNAPNVDYGGAPTSICVNDGSGARWFWRVVDGKLQWSHELWSDTIDQSPWGEIGWLRLTNDVAQTVYVYPTLAGAPTATLAPPQNSPWGWLDPVFFRDSQGGRWHLTVTTHAVGTTYWQLRAPDGSTVYLFVEAEVPTLTATVPTGVDETPGGIALDYFAVYDASAQPWYVQVADDTLTLTDSVPSGLGATTSFEGFDAGGSYWRFSADAGAQALVTTIVPAAQVVRVVADTDDAVPLVAPALALRDMVDAIGHVQAAGSLVTVLVT